MFVTDLLMPRSQCTKGSKGDADAMFETQRLGEQMAQTGNFSMAPARISPPKPDEQIEPLSPDKLRGMVPLHARAGAA
jgi:hypothetical protein